MNTSMENGMQMMFEQCELPTYPLQTAGPSVHHAKISASLEEEQDLKASEAVLCERFLESWKKQKKHISPNGLFMKMLKECCLLAEDSTSCQSSLKWTDSGTMQNGRLSIQDGMFRKIGSAYTLSDIIEEDADPKYFLSREMAEKIVQGN